MALCARASSARKRSSFCCAVSGCDSQSVGAALACMEKARTAAAEQDLAHKAMKWNTRIKFVGILARHVSLHGLLIACGIGGAAHQYVVSRCRNPCVGPAHPTV